MFLSIYKYNFKDIFLPTVCEQNKKLAGVSFIVDEETGQITGYTTETGGADTEFPFSKPSFISSDWTKSVPSGISIGTLINNDCIMMYQSSITLDSAARSAYLYSPFIDITNYNTLALSYYSRKTTTNSGAHYSPNIYLQDEAGSNVATLYTHALTAYDSYAIKNQNVDISSYSGKYRLALRVGGYGSSGSANNGATICLAGATLSI